VCLCTSYVCVCVCVCVRASDVCVCERERVLALTGIYTVIGSIYVGLVYFGETWEGAIAGPLWFASGVGIMGVLINKLYDQGSE